MIAVHRLTHPNEPLLLNPDQILTIEPTPDTVVTMMNGAKLVVIESPTDVADLVRDWRAEILRHAFVVPATAI